MVAEQRQQDAKARAEWESAVKEALEGGWDTPPPPDDMEGMDGDLSFYEVSTSLLLLRPSFEFRIKLDFHLLGVCRIIFRSFLCAPIYFISCTTGGRPAEACSFDERPHLG